MPFKRGRDEDEGSEVEEQGRKFPAEEESEVEERERMPRLTGRRDEDCAMPVENAEIVGRFAPNEEDSEVEEQAYRSGR